MTPFRQDNGAGHSQWLRCWRCPLYATRRSAPAFGDLIQAIARSFIRTDQVPATQVGDPETAVVYEQGLQALLWDLLVASLRQA